MEPVSEPHERPLTGGNVGRVGRRGDRVLRSAGAWTPAVQRLLHHVRQAGVAWAPEPHGVQADGREVVGFIDGDVPSYPLPEWVWSVENADLMGRYLRRLHDATAGYVDPAASWRQPTRQPAEVICHNDFAPYNMVFRAGRLVGVIDFDMASPGPRIWDLAYLAYRIVPLTNPDNPIDIGNHAERPGRLRRLITAYDWPFAERDVIRTAVGRMRHLAEFSDAHAETLGRDALREHADMYRADAAYLARMLAARDQRP